MGVREIAARLRLHAMASNATQSGQRRDTLRNPVSRSRLGAARSGLTLRDTLLIILDRLGNFNGAGERLHYQVRTAHDQSYKAVESGKARYKLSMPRFFTLTEAESILPKVEREIREALGMYVAHRECESKLQDAFRRITMLGGSMVNRQEISELKERQQEIASRLNDAVQKIHSYGCQIKDLETGLLDFPTLYRGAEVLLCWRFGEKGIHFWHGLEEGFQGRKRIDDEFLENHRGDRVN